MISTYEKLYEIVSPKLERYRNDLEKHDRAELETFDGPFLYGYRPTGTSILKMLPSLTEWFGEPMSYTPPLGTKQFLDLNEACDVLRQQFLWISPGADNKWFLYFTTKEFRHITAQEAEKIWKQYVFTLKMAAPMRFDHAKAIFV